MRSPNWWRTASVKVLALNSLIIIASCSVNTNSDESADPTDASITQPTDSNPIVVGRPSQSTTPQPSEDTCRPGGSRLINCDFSGQDLRGRDFSNANVSFANFKDADLRDADFSGAIAQGASFVGANLLGSNWLLANVSQSDFRSSRGLHGARFTQVIARETKFTGSMTVGDDLENFTRWTMSDFTRADLSGLSFDQFTCNGCVFEDTNMSGFTCNACQFDSRSGEPVTTFRRVDFSDARFSFTAFSGSLFEDVDFSGAVTTMMNPVRSLDPPGVCKGNWTFGPPSGATNFDGARFARTSFPGADISCFTFNNTEMRSVSFKGARWSVECDTPCWHSNTTNRPDFAVYLLSRLECGDSVWGVSGEEIADPGC